MDNIRKVGRYARKIVPSVFDSGIASRLPEEYKKFYNEWQSPNAAPVHYKIRNGPMWERLKNGEMKRHENKPIPGIIPEQLHKTLTGGEVVVHGFIRKSPKKDPVPRFWCPITYRSAVYSEILDKHMSVILTKRAIDLIHEHRGLDLYLLKTKACDLKTLIALKLKQKLLLCLSEKNLPYDESKNKQILEKYEPYLIPRNEIEWYGLTLEEAIDKLKIIEENNLKASKVPLKNIFRQQLIEELKLLSSEK